jgi:hypothetical protein
VTTYVQRVFDSTLASWCWYRKTQIDPAPLSTETMPNHANDILFGSHEIVHTENSVGLPLPIRYTGAVDATLTTLGVDTPIGSTGAFDPESYEAPTVQFEATLLFSPGTTGTAEVRLYDMGTRLTPTAGVLRSTVSVAAIDAGIRKCITKTLALSALAGVNADEILPTERVYQIRAELVGATPGDVVLVENAAIVVVATAAGGDPDQTLEWNGVDTVQFDAPILYGGATGGSVAAAQNPFLSGLTMLRVQLDAGTPVGGGALFLFSERRSFGEKRVRFTYAPDGAPGSPPVAPDVISVGLAFACSSSGDTAFAATLAIDPGASAEAVEIGYRDPGGAAGTAIGPLTTSFTRYVEFDFSGKLVPFGAGDAPAVFGRALTTRLEAASRALR